MDNDFVLVERRILYPHMDVRIWMPIHATFTGRRMVSSKGDTRIEITEDVEKRYGFLKRKRKTVKVTHWVHEKNIRTWMMEEDN